MVMHFPRFTALAYWIVTKENRAEALLGVLCLDLSHFSQEPESIGKLPHICCNVHD